MRYHPEPSKVRFVSILLPLEDPAVFQRARVNRDTGTVEWPGGADLDPDALYAWAHGTSPEAMLRIEPAS